MTWICLSVTFLACFLGKICGMGGGVIIKPVLDALGIASPSQINFLSGCTVIGMSAWSVFKSLRSGTSEINLKISTPLAIGAATGGIIGKILYDAVEGLLSVPEQAKSVQAAFLFAATFATLIYTIRKSKLPSYHVENPVICILIGLGLGLLGSFLGIGGGPFNMAVLFLFFSMGTKIAAQNSLYIILISQIAGILKNAVTGNLPGANLGLLAGMVLCGVLGSEVAARVNGKMKEQTVNRLFEMVMVLVMAICVYNVLRGV